VQEATKQQQVQIKDQAVKLHLFSLAAGYRQTSHDRQRPRLLHLGVQMSRE